MRVQPLLVVVIGLLLGLAALKQWGESAERGGPGWLTVPDTVRKEAVLWEGIAMPLEEAQRREAIEQARRRVAIEEAKLGEARRRLEAMPQKGQRSAGGYYSYNPNLPASGTSARDAPWSAGSYFNLSPAEIEISRQEDKLRESQWEVSRQEAKLGEARREVSIQSAAPLDLFKGASVRSLDPQAFPAVSIGQPEVWHLPDLYPPQKMPRLMQAQLQAADFYLIRLFCSFRPAPRSRVGWARFHVVLLPDSLGRQPLAYDISPLEITKEVKRQLKFTLAPMLKFQAVEAEVGSLEFGLEYPELQPIIVGAGVGEAIPTWDYQTATGMASIQGTKWMHLLIKAPKGMPAATAQLAVTAQLYVESITSWIPVVAGPAEQGTRLDVRLWSEAKVP
jgi:hypothetical protein